MQARRPRRLGTLAVLATGVMLATLAAGGPALQLMPISNDDVTWILEGAVSNPDWPRWVFATPHFIGYRPVTALSYTLDSVFAGLDPLGYRVSNMIWHALAAFAVYWCGRALWARGPAWACAAAAILFALHPVSSEVVPFLARRSYAMTTALGLAAVALASVPRSRLHAAAWSKIGLRSAAAGLAAAAAVGAHELGLVAAAMSALSGWLSGWKRPGAFGRRLLLACGPLAGAGIVLAARFAVLGGVGGYEPGEDAGGAGRAGPILLATLQQAAWLSPVSGEQAGIAPAPVAVAAMVGVGGAIVAVWVGRGRLWRGSNARCVVVLAGLLTGFAALSATQGVWFVRQVYPPAAPLCLLLGVLLVESARGRPALATRLVLGAPGAALAAWLLWQSPLLAGLPPDRMAHGRATDRLLRETEQAIATLPDGTLVRLVLPVYAEPAMFRISTGDTDAAPLWIKHPGRWLGARLAASGRRIRVEPWVFVANVPPGQPGPAIGLAEQLEPMLRLPGGWRYHLLRPGAAQPGPRRLESDASALLPLSLLTWPESPAYIFIWASDGDRLLRAPPVSSATGEAR